MESLWKMQTHLQERAKGQEAKHRDVVVVGAGMAGLLIAFLLQEQGRDVLVLEADKIASGQTERTTAKITSQHGLKYCDLIKKVGVKQARLYAQANEEAICEYERLIKKYGIDCQFERVPSYLYSRENANLMRQEAEAAASLGIDAFFTKNTELPFEVEGAVCFRNQARFQPLDFVKHISEYLNIWDDTQVTGIHANRVVTKNTVITANQIVVATHYPFINVPGFYFLRQHQERSYVLALSGCKRFEGMYYGIDKDGLSFRSAGETLLLGGGGHRTGENEEGGIYDRLTDAANRYFPKCGETTRWSAQDCMPHDKIPFIGRYSVWSSRIFVATGFQKWGMTTAMVSAMLLRDLLCGKENPYTKLFRPQRLRIRAGAANLFTDIGMSVRGLVKGVPHLPRAKADRLPCGHGGIVTMNHRRYACYRDETGGFHKISARCPHMGCELTWNPDEKSWDCPCHGSRFNVDGRLLDNPAEKNVQKK